MVILMSEELKAIINHIVKNDLDKLSIEGLFLLKNMIVYYSTYENEENELLLIDVQILKKLGIFILNIIDKYT